MRNIEATKRSRPTSKVHIPLTLLPLQHRQDGSVRPRARGSSRDEKVARFRAQQKCSEEIKMITGKLQRRGRMDLSPEEMFEGGDEECK